MTLELSGEDLGALERVLQLHCDEMRAVLYEQGEDGGRASRESLERLERLARKLQALREADETYA